MRWRGFELLQKLQLEAKVVSSPSNSRVVVSLDQVAVSGLGKVKEGLWKRLMKPDLDH